MRLTDRHLRWMLKHLRPAEVCMMLAMSMLQSKHGPARRVTIKQAVKLAGLPEGSGGRHARKLQAAGIFYRGSLSNGSKATTLRLCYDMDKWVIPVLDRDR